jgi:hypothetical protein
MGAQKTARIIVVTAVLVAGGACEGGVGFEGEGEGLELPDAGHLEDLDIPAPPAIDFSALPFPTAADGNAIVIELSDGRIELDPTANDAITAVGACTDLVTYCFTPPALTLSACVAVAPTCFTDEPWTEPVPCCPAACKADFAAAVDVGGREIDAFQDVFFRAPACFPGVTDALGAP